MGDSQDIPDKQPEYPCPANFQRFVHQAVNFDEFHKFLLARSYHTTHLAAFTKYLEKYLEPSDLQTNLLSVIYSYVDHHPALTKSHSQSLITQTNDDDTAGKKRRVSDVHIPDTLESINLDTPLAEYVNRKVNFVPDTQDEHPTQQPVNNMDVDDAQTAMRRKLEIVGPPPQPNDLPPRTTIQSASQAQSEAMAVMAELVRQMRNTHVDPEVLTWEQFCNLPFLYYVEQLQMVPTNNLKISDRDAHAIANLLMLWPDRDNMSPVGLRHLCIQVALFTFVVQYGWQHALKICQNISEKQHIAGRTISLTDHREHLRKAQGRQNNTRSSANATRAGNNNNSQRSSQSQRSNTPRRRGPSQNRASQNTQRTSNNANATRQGGGSQRATSQSRRSQH
jgi:hypothetical protein